MAEQPINHERTPQAKRPAGRGRGLAFQLAALLLTVVSALAGTGLARWLRSPGGGEAKDRPAPKGLAALFKGWPRPDLALVLTGQEHGYLLPCGCSDPQIGGLERRYNFLQMLKEEGWKYVAVDLGDVPQKQGPVGLPNHQGRVKYLYAMRARKAMGYSAVGFGEYETHLGLLDVVAAEWGLNESPPSVVNANLLNRDKLFPGLEKTWESAEPLGRGGLKVGVTSVISPAAKDRVKDRTVKDNLGRSDKALDVVLAEMDKQKVGLRVLLYQGRLGRGAPKPAEAVACAEAYPQFPVIVCLSEEAEDNAPATPVTVTTRSGSRSLVIKVGLKGKWVGVVGVYRTGKPDRPFEFRYQPVEMTPSYDTPKGREKDHPIVKLMEQYTAELRGDLRRYPGGKYLVGYSQSKHLLQAMAPVKGLRNPGKANDPTYVGSKACKRCHDHAYAIWEKTPHSHAYQTLVEKAKKPSNRQYDPECVVCHTVGFRYEGGFRDAVRTPNLKDVGCESCHGPASLHVLNPTNEEWQKRINPWKYLPEAKRTLATDQFCQTCHDIDNDVTWIHDGGFKTKWPKIAHPTPKPADE